MTPKQDAKQRKPKSRSRGEPFPLALSILAGKNLLRRNPCDMIGIMKILLNAINAKYIHSNLAVYSLRAYAKEYREHIRLLEYTINNRVEEILEGIYKEHADVICFSCYIWNIAYVKELIE